MNQEFFWQNKTLKEMSRHEWESLCDGCARCCLIKLEDEDNGEVSYTNVACRLLDIGACACSDYKNRLKKVQGCVALSAETIGSLGWLPKTCAYRLLSEGRELYWWHPLVSGDPETVHRAGISVRYDAVPEGRVPDEELKDHIFDLPDPD